VAEIEKLFSNSTPPHVVIFYICLAIKGPFIIIFQVSFIGYTNEFSMADFDHFLK